MSSPVNECVPLYRDGDVLTGHVVSDVIGKRFVKVSAGFQSGPGLNTSAAGGNVQIALADPGGRVFGVAAYDKAAADRNPKVPCLRGSKFVLPVTADGSITAGDTLQVGSAGKAKTQAVGSATAATLQTGLVASNNGLTWTARDAGVAGNGISIQILGSTGAGVSLSVAVNGNDIVVTPATNGSSVITSTAAQVATAIAASAAANSLVTVANTGASTGAGVVSAVSATNLSGGAEAALGIAVAYALSSATDGQDVFASLF